MTAPGDTVVVGFSGGADSTALLDVLFNLRDILGITPVAVHVNHGMRQEAFLDEEFASDYCKERGIPLTVVKRDVPAIAARRGLSEEEAGRLVRYEAFEAEAKKYGRVKIAVAHHQGDVAETFLLNLCRGSGLRGLTGIRPVRDNVIRPLLCASRRDIEEYLESIDQPFCTDRTNFENDHTRNVLRNIIIPELERSVNSESSSHILRAALSVTEAEDYIRDTAKREFDLIAARSGDGISLDVRELLKVPEVIRKNIILLSFEELVTSRKDITSAHVQGVLNLICDSGIGDGQGGSRGLMAGSSHLDLPYNLEAERNYESLYIGKKITSSADHRIFPLVLSVNDKKIFELPGGVTVRAEVFSRKGKTDIPGGTYTKWFDYDRIQETVFRTRRKGDVISINMGGTIHKKPINKFMTDEKIPKRDRDKIFLLANGREILWVPGYRRCDIFKIDDSTGNILAVSIINGGNSNG